MRKVLGNRIVQLVIFVAVIGGVFGLGYRAGVNHVKVDDMPGQGWVIGNNPKHIPESELPQCAFDGTQFLQEPCYSPPNSRYD